MRRHRTIKCEFDIPENIKYYGDVYHVYPEETSKEMFELILNHKGQKYCEDNILTESSARSKLWRDAMFLVPSYEKASKDFDAFVKDNAWVKDFYEFCVDKGVYRSIGNNNWTTISKAKGGEDYIKLRSEFNFQNFATSFAHKYLVIYNELQRKVPFVAGNIVILRDKYINSDGHDPFVRKPDLRKCERIGTVISVTDSIHNWSYGGKGSRLVNVLWSASGETTTASINSLKLFDRKDKMVDKLVER